MRIASNTVIMAYIHELAGWPDLSWDSETLAMKLAAVRHKQGLHLGRMQSLGFDLRTEASLAAMAEEAVKSSAIEGEVLNTEEVRSSISRQLGLDIRGLEKSSWKVDGVVEMTLDATQNFSDPLTAERLFAWHAALLPSGHSGIHPITVGGWRKDQAGPMQVMSGPVGREKVHFQAPPAVKLGDEMARFLDWFNAPPSIDPVLFAGVAHFWFVTIHPFDDGNGRLGRAIADLALARADGTKERSYSMSSGIEALRKIYYQQLSSAQNGSLDITAWLSWFLDCFGSTIDASESTLRSVLNKARLWEKINVTPVNERQRLVINRMLDDFKGHLSTSKYGKLAKCSNDTALRDIRSLLSRGIILKNPGGGRSTSYRLIDPMTFKA